MKGLHKYKIDINILHLKVFAHWVIYIGSGSSSMLHRHVSTVAQSRQTKHWLFRGPFTFLGDLLLGKAAFLHLNFTLKTSRGLHRHISPVAGRIRSHTMAPERCSFTRRLGEAERRMSEQRQRDRQSEAQTSAMFYDAQSAECLHLNQH